MSAVRRFSVACCVTAIVATAPICSASLHGDAAAGPSAAPAPIWIDNAITFGQTQKAMAPIRLGSRNGLFSKLTAWKNDPGIAMFTTPFVRVALAAADAKQKFKPFTAKDVPTWMLQPVITVYLPAYVGAGNTTTPEHVVIHGAGNMSPDHAIQPSHVRDFDPARDWVVQVGETRVGASFIADFPISALRLENEFSILFRDTKPMTFRITKDMLALAGCPLACQ